MELPTKLFETLVPKKVPGYDTILKMSGAEVLASQAVGDGKAGLFIALIRERQNGKSHYSFVSAWYSREDDRYEIYQHITDPEQRYHHLMLVARKLHRYNPVSIWDWAFSLDVKYLAPVVDFIQR